jgi:hypothetical protein
VVVVMLVGRRESLTTSLPLVEESAGRDPKDWTESARWPPMSDGFAGEEDKKAFGESTDPKAIGPTDWCQWRFNQETRGR